LLEKFNTLLYKSKINFIPLKYIPKSFSKSTINVWDFDDLKKKLHTGIKCSENLKSADCIQFLPDNNVINFIEMKDLTLMYADKKIKVLGKTDVVKLTKEVKAIRLQDKIVDSKLIMIYFLHKHIESEYFFSFLSNKHRCKINFYFLTNLSSEEQLDFMLNFSPYFETLNYRFLNSFVCFEDI
jgi:hypothetical protein